MAGLKRRFQPHIMLIELRERAPAGGGSPIENSRNDLRGTVRGCADRCEQGAEIRLSGLIDVEFGGFGNELDDRITRRELQAQDRLWRRVVAATPLHMYKCALDGSGGQV